MGFADDANALIQEKKFDDLESLWMNQLESDPSDVDAFLRTAKSLRKSEQRTKSDGSPDIRRNCGRRSKKRCGKPTEAGRAFSARSTLRDSPSRRAARSKRPRK